MQIPLSRTSRKDGTITYGVHPLFRLGFAAIAAALAAASVSFGQTSAFGLALVAISLFGALYQERWVFPRTGSTFSFHAGILPFVRTRSWEYSGIADIKAFPFLKGELDQTKTEEILREADSGISKHSFMTLIRKSRAIVRLTIELNDGDTLLVDETGIRSRAKIESLARDITAIVRHRA